MQIIRKFLLGLLILSGTISLYSQAFSGAAFGGLDNDAGHSICLASDGGYVLAGSSRSCGAGSNDVSVLKLNAFGQLKWEKYLGGEKTDFGQWIEATSDGGYIVAGFGVKPGTFNSTQQFLAKLTGNGDTEWTKYYYGFNGFCVKGIPNDGYVLLGYVQKYGALGGFHLLRLDEEGERIWSKQYLDDDRKKAYGYEVEITPDGGYIMVGIDNGYHSPRGHGYQAASSGILIIKTDEKGQEI